MKRYDLDIDDLVSRYLSGESEKGLADSLGVARTVIRRRLIESGIEPRDRSAAELVKWSRMTTAQRTAQTDAAHKASRGRTATVTERETIAATTAARWYKHITPDERQLMTWLDQQAFPTIPQQAIGPYNCDLGAFPVAVEIFGGNWHWTGHHRDRLSERCRYFFDAGWHILIVHITDWYPLRKTAADHIVAYHQLTSGNPTGRREYRMIRGDSEPMLICTEDDEIPVVYPFRSRRDPITGRYESIPR